MFIFIKTLLGLVFVYLLIKITLFTISLFFLITKIVNLM